MNFSEKMLMNTISVETRIKKTHHKKTQRRRDAENYLNTKDTEGTENAPCGAEALESKLVFSESKFPVNYKQ